MSNSYRVFEISQKKIIETGNEKEFIRASDIEFLLDTIKRLREENETLQDRVYFLDCLEACGVDNWIGYSDAQEMMNEED